MSATFYKLYLREAINGKNTIEGQFTECTISGINGLTHGAVFIPASNISYAYYQEAQEPEVQNQQKASKAIKQAKIANGNSRK